MSVELALGGCLLLFVAGVGVLIGNLIFRDSCQDVENSNNSEYDNCGCTHGFEGHLFHKYWGGIHGNCTPAPCYVFHSNGAPGPACRCKDGFQGEIEWTGSTASGTCVPGVCEVENAHVTGDALCVCDDGFAGKLEFIVNRWSGICRPVPCEVEQSNMLPGPLCACADGFAGRLVWEGATVHGQCLPASCQVGNAVQTSPGKCECARGFHGSITFDGSTGQGRCDPAPCVGKNTNGVAGLGCACQNGFVGIFWEEGAWVGSCEPAICNIDHSDGTAGLGCRCADGFSGTITWAGSKPQGQCRPVECDVANSNRRPGPACACSLGYVGGITWQGTQSNGSCVEAPCIGLHTNGLNGPDCRCEVPFGGISWDSGSGWVGECLLMDIVTVPSAFTASAVLKVLLVMLVQWRRIRHKKPAFQKLRPQHQQQAAPSQPEQTSAPPPLEENARTLCAVGLTGYGKSTLCCVLADKETFARSAAFASVTASCSHEDFRWGEPPSDKYRMIDTPGLEDTRLSPKDITDRICRFANLSPLGVDVFLFVCRYGDRFKPNDEKAFKTFVNACGEAALQHTILVFTHGGGAAGESGRQQVIEQAVDLPILNDVLRKVNKRVCVVDPIHDSARARLLVMGAVEDMCNNNRGRYCNNNLNEARHFHDSMLEKIHQLAKAKNRQACEDALNRLHAGEKETNFVQELYDECLKNETNELELNAEVARLSTAALETCLLTSLREFDTCALVFVMMLWAGVVILAFVKYWVMGVTSLMTGLVIGLLAQGMLRTPRMAALEAADAGLIAIGVFGGAFDNFVVVSVACGAWLLARSVRFAVVMMRSRQQIVAVTNSNLMAILVAIEPGVAPSMDRIFREAKAFMDSIGKEEQSLEEEQV